MGYLAGISWLSLGVGMSSWLLLGSVLAQEPVGTHFETVEDRLVGLQQVYTTEQLELLEKLNRSDLEHLGRMHELVVPDAWTGELAYSLLPARYPSAETTPKLLVVYLPAQLFGAYEFGRLIRWGPISSGGRNTPTPAGVFHLNWRAREHTSTRNAEWLMRWTFNFENHVGLSFHEDALPGTPASHACIRLLGRDARWIFAWGEPWVLDVGEARILKEGTPVLIVGRYEFSESPPWRVDGVIPIAQLPERRLW